MAEGVDSSEDESWGSIMSGLVRVGEGAPIGTWGLEGTGIFNDYNALALYGEYCLCMLGSAAMREMAVARG